MVMQENPAFLTEQIITYLGNKRALLDFIGQAVLHVKRILGREQLRCFDAFSGSGIVARFLKQHASVLYVNDLEAYSRLFNECYLTNREEIDFPLLERTLAELRQNIVRNWHRGFLGELYAPRDEKNIQPGERVFFTIRNADYLNTARDEIAKLPKDLQKFFLGPLLYGASVHNNTGGVFKGFYKNQQGIGQYGGTGRNALDRILGDIELTLPVFSNFTCETHIFQQDATEAALRLPHVDLAYLDPPYNQHPYGSNYFMLNVLLENRQPQDISRVSGIPTAWNRSNYNKRGLAQKTLFELIQTLDASFILLSYNSEGFIQQDTFVKQLQTLGQLEIFSTPYITFRASRNLNQRNLHVKEYLFLLHKQ
ncbi:MAG: DNA adenine methylase [Victivallales bacterium]|nr:DNA adenine methylase [Victivallales bacterium]